MLNLSQACVGGTLGQGWASLEANIRAPPISCQILNVFDFLTLWLILKTTNEGP